VPLTADTDILGYTAVIDGSTCNGTNQSGCGNTPHLVQVGSVPFLGVIDPTTKTVYIMSEFSSKISVINAATCNGRNQSGCPQRAPALAVGVNRQRLRSEPARLGLRIIRTQGPFTRRTRQTTLFP
jgi:hypothetical protein